MRPRRNLTEEEIRQVFAGVDTSTKLAARDYALLLLLLDKGIRAGELCGLTLDNVHLDREPGWIKVMGKGGKERIVILGRRAHEAVQACEMFSRGKSSNACFFLSKSGEPLNRNSIGHIMQYLSKKVGIPRLQAHLLRHTAVTRYLVTGGDLVTLQHKLGYTTLKMTSHYLHLAQAHLQMIQERISPMDKVKIPPMSRRRILRPGR